MKRAAAEALAGLARQDVPDAVVKAYGDEPLQFGPDCLIPKPLDQRVLYEVTPAVAQAAIDSGTSRLKLDLDAYRERLEARLGKSREMMWVVLNKAKSDPKRVALAEGENEKIIRAASQMIEEGIAEPILIGQESQIRRTVDDLGLDFDAVIANPGDDEWDHYVDQRNRRRQRTELTHKEASELVHNDSDYFASMMVEMGDADAMLTGFTHHYPSALRPPLQVIGTAEDADYAAGVYMLTFRNQVVFCADTTVNLDPDEEVLAEVTKHTAELARRFNIEPCAALLSYSDLGSVDDDGVRKPRNAVSLLRDDPHVEFDVDGEMQADTALVEEMLTGTYDFTDLDGPANVLIFPNLEAGNIGYKLLRRLGGAEAIGPMLVGMDKPAHILQRADEVTDIVTLAGIAVADAQQQDSGER